MKIALIAPYSDITSFGVRMLSAVCRHEGHQVSLIFLNDTDGEHRVGEEYRFHEDLVRDLLTKVASADIIGFSLMTLYFDRIRQLSMAIRDRYNDKFIVWGGVHPTIKPEQCLEFADAVALGEADKSFPRLIAAYETGQNYTATEGFWFTDNTDIIRNAVPALITDLDSLPQPDYTPDEHYFLADDKKSLVPVTETVLQNAFSCNPIWKMEQHVYYQTMATRGCPHNCTYCCNNAYRMLYGRSWKVRYRSPEHVIEELETIRHRFPYLSAIVFSDDSFFSYPLEQIVEFGKLYRQRIGLPFRCLTSPLTLSREKLECLLDSGLFSLQMGIQTGSSAMKKLYRRSINNDRVLDAVCLINEYSSRMEPPLYDFILDNPRETIDDCLETIQLVSKIPRPYFLQLFSLVVFPGTELYGSFSYDLPIEKLEGYRRPFSSYKASWCNIIMLLYHYRCPGFLLDFLRWPPLFRIMMNKPMSMLVNLSFTMWKSFKTVISKKDR